MKNSKSKKYLNRINSKKGGGYSDILFCGSNKKKSEKLVEDIKKYLYKQSDLEKLYEEQIDSLKKIINLFKIELKPEGGYYSKPYHKLPKNLKVKSSRYSNRLNSKKGGVFCKKLLDCDKEMTGDKHFNEIYLINIKLTNDLELNKLSEEYKKLKEELKKIKKEAYDEIFEGIGDPIIKQKDLKIEEINEYLETEFLVLQKTYRELYDEKEWYKNYKILLNIELKKRCPEYFNKGGYYRKSNRKSYKKLRRNSRRKSSRKPRRNSRRK